MSVKTIICSFCESEHLNLITDTVRFDHKADVYRCQNCGLTFLDQGSFKFPEDFYKNHYHQTYLTHIEPDVVDPKKYYEKMKKATQVWADRLTKILTGQEVVLDVGCSSGHFMDLVKNRTRKIYGSELNKKEIEFCQHVLNLDVSDEPLDKRFEKETFDYITLIFVLEHIADPQGFLSYLEQFLKPEGKFVIVVPNGNDALVNFYDIAEFRKFYYCIEHLYYFDEQSIKKLFDKVKLSGSIEIIQEYPVTNHLQWAYTRKPSDVLASRKNIPNVPMGESAPLEAWEKLWAEFNQKYQEFLKRYGYGDRLWCVVGK